MSDNSNTTVDEDKTEMSLMGHLKELRNRLIYSLIAVIIFSAGAGYFHHFVITDLILGPAEQVGLHLQNLKVFGQPIFYFKVIMVAGVILALPVILYNIWQFIKPALYSHEIRYLRLITMLSSICFFGGVFFAYKIIIPGMLAFANQFGTTEIDNVIDVNNYLSFLTLIVVSMGILFEMPVASFLLTKAGLLSPKTMLKYWRHGIVVILIIAAVVTPTPDPVSQLIFAAPLFILYVISIFISVLASPKKTKDETEDETEDEVAEADIADIDEDIDKDEK